MTNHIVEAMRFSREAEAQSKGEGLAILNYKLNRKVEELETQIEELMLIIQDLTDRHDVPSSFRKEN